MIFLLSAACDEPPVPKTQLFERAEQYYRDGIYERALDDYSAFVVEHPDSPLSDVARMRIRTIKREVSSMLENERFKNVKYHGADRAENAKIEAMLQSEQSPETTNTP